MLLVETRENNWTFHNANNAAFFDMMKMILDRSVTGNERLQKKLNVSLQMAQEYIKMFGKQTV